MPEGTAKGSGRTVSKGPAGGCFRGTIVWVVRRRGDGRLKTRVYVACERDLCRIGLREWLGKQENVELIGVTENPGRLVEEVTEKPIDVVLLQMSVSRRESEKIIRDCLKQSDSPSFVLLTEDDDVQQLHSFLELGVKAFLSLETGSDQVLKAINSVQRGRRYIDPGFSDSIVDRFLGEKTDVAD